MTTARPPTPAEEPAAAIDEARIADVLLRRLERSAVGATVCPSEVARELAADPVVWRGLMPHVRAVAQRLTAEGRVRVTRRGVDVDATSAGGPIRLSRPTGDRTE